MNVPTVPALRNGISLAMVVLLSACSASSTPSGETAVSAEREPWFCETGADSEAWNCVQSETLARAPQPSRSPPRRPPHSPNSLHESLDPIAPATPIAPLQRDAPSTPQPSVERAEPASRPDPHSSSSEGAAAAAQTRDHQVPSEARGARSRGSEDHLPKHVRLAYRPETAVSMMDIPPEFWAVQLIALSSKEALEAYARQHNVKGMPAARIAVDGKLFYILLLGIYETRALATEASAELPAPFSNPWIRSVRSLQRAMAQADDLTGGAMND